MKTSIKLIITLVTFLSASHAIDAQQISMENCSSSTTNRTIKLENSSENEDITIAIPKDLGCMHIAISSTINSGYLTVEIYDPKGNKKGNFSIESQVKSSASKSEMVCGQLQKQINDPIAGDWVVKLIPNNVSGDISINTLQMERKQ